MTRTFTIAQQNQLIQLVRLAASDIMAIYQQPELTNATDKQDNSPLTAADLAAHRRLNDGLRLVLDIPILSEESPPEDYAQRHQWNAFWLVDPLDGTREFLARNGQFTINVALIYQGIALLGVVYQPVTQLCYWGYVDHPDWQFPLEGAWRQQTSAPEKIHCDSLIERKKSQQVLRCLISQHHNSPHTDQYLQKLESYWPAEIEKRALGSSLKICAIAEGSADLYLRTGPTSEWDTAAAQAILEAAGGQLVRFDQRGEAFRYNQRKGLLNNDFCACTHPKLITDWLLSSE